MSPRLSLLRLWLDVYHLAWKETGDEGGQAEREVMRMVRKGDRRSFASEGWLRYWENKVKGGD